MQFNTICLSGGGDKGLIILGILQKCIEFNIIKFNNITKFYGTSVGSFLNLFMVLGYSLEEICNFFLELNFEEFEPNINIDILFNNLGLDDGVKFKLLINKVISTKLKKDNINFLELFSLTQKELYVVSFNYTKNKEVLFSHKTTPYISVTDAIRASCCVPMFYKPIKIKDNLFIDGGIINNFPINYCNLEETLGICFKNNIFIKNDLMNYMNNLFCILFQNLNFKHNIDYSKVFVVENNDSFINFNLNKKEKKEILLKGESICEKICNTNLNFLAIKFVKKIIKDSLTKIKVESTFT
jgi:predicted acylesterase/phospholipase RssA